MFLFVICAAAIGILVGVIFTLLYVTFDQNWKKVIIGLVSFGSTSCVFVQMCNLLNIYSSHDKALCIISCIGGFLFAFIFTLRTVSILIKDKDDRDIIRIRDILLGQKSYIEKYYDKRKNEIDIRLNTDKIVERERKIEKREQEFEEYIKRKMENLKSQENFLNVEKNKLTELGKDKLCIILPEGKEIYISQKFLEQMPSYIEGIGKFLVDINKQTEQFVLLIGKQRINFSDLKSYLTAIASLVMADIFDDATTNIRVHFRYYDRNDGYYKSLVCIKKEGKISKKMTPIPFKDSMIEKSYKCKRAVIKSLNPESDYRGAHAQIWTDYITFAFYGLTIDDLPFLTFGISTKNSERYRDLFYLICFFKFENYLEEHFEIINDKLSLSNIIYKNKGGKQNGKNPKGKGF